MPRLVSALDPDSDTFRRNREVNLALANSLRARIAAAALGGPPATRARHASRGKLLPRQRVERLLDIGAPFLELSPLAAGDLYDGEAPGAGLIAGVGRVQTKGGPMREIRPGDVVWIPAGEKHWHGGSPTTGMTHLAMQEALDGQTADWMEPVTDAQYAVKVGE